MKKILALVLVAFMVVLSSTAFASADSKKVHMSRVGVFSVDSDIEGFVDIESSYGSRLEGLHVYMTVPELGVRRSVGPFMLGGDDETVKRLLVDTYGAEPGDYYVRFTVSNDNIRRVKHRMITI